MTDAGYLVIGVTILVLALAAGILKRRFWFSEPVVATAVGILVGPAVLGLFDPLSWHGHAKVLEEVARITLAISLIGVAFRLPPEWLRRRWRSVALLLVAGMAGMWVLSTAASWLVFGLPLAAAALLGAIVTPTDPVLASSIVTGELAKEAIDDDVRHLISAESGANDGLAYLLVMLPVVLVRPSGGVIEWLGTVLLVDILGAVAIGAAAGWVVGRLLCRASRHGHPTQPVLLAVVIALALALLGGVKLLGLDGILSAFAAGLVLDLILPSDSEEGYERVQEATKGFLDVPLFTLFGAMLPWAAWAERGWWRLAVFAAALLLVRRIPVILALRPWLRGLNLRSALFVGWFGPIGVAALVYATWVDHHHGREGRWVMASFAIFASIVVHGITGTPFTRWMGDPGDAERARRKQKRETPVSG